MKYLKSKYLTPGTKILGRLLKIEKGQYGQNRFNMETPTGSIILDTCATLDELIKPELVGKNIVLTYDGLKSEDHPGGFAMYHDWQLSIDAE